MPLSLDEIVIAFKGCNGDNQISFKEYLKRLDKNIEDYKRGFTIDNSFNYILSDIERVIDKSILNICAADLLIKKGYLSWGFVTSYYANFFLAQSLNRLQLNFFTWVNCSIKCSYTNYLNKELKIVASDQSSDSHQREFQTFYNNFMCFRQQEGFDRHWGIGLHSFKRRGDLGESGLRNLINYEINLESFNELNFEFQRFNKILKSNKKSPFEFQNETFSKYTNYARENLALSISRLKISLYILNYIAVRNLEYQSYYARNMKRRIRSIKEKYPGLSSWIISYFEEWFSLNHEIVPDEISVNFPTQ
ncbi:hypothetical protein IQ218_12210 [Synechocystis salina LEGE 06099]|uniref:hypothetical protein n=1 Tax=Synechocystis salina TaxID=945780 RepID=UPI0018804AF2|nr:hypothetical protein [Synechocystis salina]MBE9204061.1 hypothetical protein [Synechocystis salina LEGE 06099]